MIFLAANLYASGLYLLKEVFSERSSVDLPLLGLPVMLLLPLSLYLATLSTSATMAAWRL